MSIYKSFEQAKNGTSIPVFLSGRSMESRYNPERDAENLCASISEKHSFFLVLGIGSGLFIQKLSERFPSAKIIGLELFEEDITFLNQSKVINQLKEKENIIFSSLHSIEKTLCENYLPAKHDEIKIIEQRAWIQENKDYIENINHILQKALGIISADYSVQAHFGKIWTSNILNNSKLVKSEDYQNNFDTSKTAVIVAAGPTLDKTISILNEREKYFVISTDTATSVLVRHSITPDVIISIDGQNVSYNHFHKCPATLYAFDLCSNFSAAKHVSKHHNKIMFFCSGHPLSLAINSCNQNKLPFLFSGAGTVTITAVDFAIQAGFTNLLILGADFSYSNGKAYAHGTYLDSLYHKASSKINSSEHSFSKLFYRAPLNQKGSVFTTDILEAYRTSLEKYLENKNIIFIKENDVYKLDCSNCNSNQTLFPNQSENTSWKFSLSSFFEKFESSTPEEAETILLPYIAWLKNNKKYKNSPYSELLKLAFNTIVSYNK